MRPRGQRIDMTWIHRSTVTTKAEKTGGTSYQCRCRPSALLSLQCSGSEGTETCASKGSIPCSAVLQPRVIYDCSYDKRSPLHFRVNAACKRMRFVPRYACLMS